MDISAKVNQGKVCPNKEDIIFNTLFEENLPYNDMRSLLVKMLRVQDIMMNLPFHWCFCTVILLATRKTIFTKQHLDFILTNKISARFQLYFLF